MFSAGEGGILIQQRLDEMECDVTGPGEIRNVFLAGEGEYIIPIFSLTTFTWLCYNSCTKNIAPYFSRDNGTYLCDEQTHELKY